MKKKNDALDATASGVAWLVFGPGAYGAVHIDLNVVHRPDDLGDLLERLKDVFYSVFFFFSITTEDTSSTLMPSFADVSK